MFATVSNEMKNIRHKEAETELTLIRKIAGASRPLDKDLNLSALQAIDRLQKLDEQFAPLWWKHPFLVLEDSFTLPAPMPVSNMLAQIEAHGQPIGVVGVAVLSTRKWIVLKQMFRKDAKAVETVEGSAAVAVSIFEDSLRSPYSGKVYTNGERASIFYSWEPTETPEPGYQLAGFFDLVQNDKGEFELKIKKVEKWAEAMDQARKLFEPKMQELAALLSGMKTQNTP